MPIAGYLQTDAGGRYFMGPVDESSGLGKAPRAANISGEYADFRVVLYDAAGNALVLQTASGVLYASAARTTDPTPADQTNANARGLHVIIDVTAITATPSVVFTIQGKDPASGKYYTLLASAAITAAGTTVLRVYPGLTVAANLTANDVLPRTWRVVAVHGDADSITYSVGYSLIP